MIGIWWFRKRKWNGLNLSGTLQIGLERLVHKRLNQAKRFQDNEWNIILCRSIGNLSLLIPKAKIDLIQHFSRKFVARTMSQGHTVGKRTTIETLKDRIILEANQQYQLNLPFLYYWSLDLPNCFIEIISLKLNLHLCFLQSCDIFLWR